MKKSKKLTSLLMACMMMMSMCVPTFAVGVREQKCDASEQ